MGEGGHHYGGVGQATEEGIHSPFKSIHNCLQQIQRAPGPQGTGEAERNSLVPWDDYEGPSDSEEEDGEGN